MFKSVNNFQIGSAIFFAILAFLINGLTDLKFWPLCFGAIAVGSLIGNNKIGYAVFGLGGIFFLIALFVESEWLLNILNQLK